MKELTLEQKAKAYDELLVKLQEAKVDDNVCDERYCCVIDNIVPELKESDDERMKEAIIATIHLYYGEPLEDEAKEMIAWLEKKIEQKPAEYEKPLLEKFKQAVYDCACGKVTCKVEGESQEEYANRWAEHLLMLVRDWADDYIDKKEDVIARRAYDKGKQDIQKPAWSKEDEKILKDIITDVKFEGYNNDMQANSYKKINWLKSLKDRVQPQLKQEWSEEDEQLYNDLSDTYFYNDEDYPEETYKLMLKRVLDWMTKRAKSLRPQSHWRPSDEQMDALETAASSLQSTTLESLYNELKKL